MASTIQSTAAKRRTLLAKLTKGDKNKQVSKPVRHRNDDVPKFLKMLDKFERTSARTRNLVGH